MLATVVYKHADYSQLQIKTYENLEDAQEFVKSTKNSKKYLSINIMVDYGTVEFYKKEFEKYQTIVLEMLTEKGHVTKETIKKVMSVKD